MKIIYKQGDLLSCTEPILLHGCNMQGVMGSGVAKAVRKKWPDTYAFYRETFERGDLRLGDILIDFRDDKYVVHAITQEYYGRVVGTTYVSYDAIRKCCKRANDFFRAVPQMTSIAMPKIGAGLGGGDWNIISAIIEDEFKDVQPVVYEL